MRVRSRALWQFLSDAQVLDKDEATIAKYKKLYRKEYKQKWKKERRLKQFELRPGFTGLEFSKIQAMAKRAGMKASTFAREVVLAAVTNTDLIPNKPLLLKALQYVTIAAIELSKTNAETRILVSIDTAEKILLQYLFQNDTQADPSSHREL